MPILISITVTACLNYVKELEAEQPGHRHGGEFPFVSWTDEFDRLRGWIANVGADRIGRSSLESIQEDPSSCRAVVETIKVLQIQVCLDFAPGKWSPPSHLLSLQELKEGYHSATSIDSQ